MADITIDANVQNALQTKGIRTGPFWTSPTVGYVIYADSTNDLVYQKTSDGGATWGGKTLIKAGEILAYDCWADWQTAGDAGTKINIIYATTTTNDVRYIYLDTSDDSVGGDDQIEACQGTGTISIGNLRKCLLSITKTRGGNIAVAFRYEDSGSTQFESFYTSADGATWNTKTSPWETAGDDQIKLYPGNEADNQDLWAVFWDMDANEISLKTFDDSGNSWGEQLISGSMATVWWIQNMDGQIRLSDGHLIFTAWSEHNTATADLKVWDINGAGSITAKANVITDEAENDLASVFINQLNDDLYITYMQGTAINSLVSCVYKKSTNGGGAWGGETAMQADAEDDELWVSAGAMKAEGKFQPVWFNTDLTDLFTNSDNGVSIAVVATRGWMSK